MSDRTVLSLADARRRREHREAEETRHAKARATRRPTLAEIMDGDAPPGAA